VTLLVDTGPLVALGDRRDRMQASVERALTAETGDLVVPATVAAEADHLLGRRGGRIARLRLLDDLAAGRFILAGLTTDDISLIRDLETRYAELDAGLTDLSIVVIAARVGTERILTFDAHFRVLRPLGGAPAFDIILDSVA
jgi:predicted nucleic acid-binding protein